MMKLLHNCDTPVLQAFDDIEHEQGFVEIEGTMLQSAQLAEQLFLILTFYVRPAYVIVNINVFTGNETRQAQTVVDQLHRQFRNVVQALLDERGLHPVSYEDWRKIDLAERQAGETAGRPRVKRVTREEMREALEG